MQNKKLLNKIKRLKIELTKMYKSTRRAKDLPHFNRKSFEILQYIESQNIPQDQKEYLKKLYAKKMLDRRLEKYPDSIQQTIDKRYKNYLLEYSLKSYIKKYILNKSNNTRGGDSSPHAGGKHHETQRATRAKKRKTLQR